MANPRNDRNQAVTKFCLAMEEHRRTEPGRVRTAKEFVASFFPHDERAAEDRLFVLMPNDVRGPVVSKWGIRGTKAALRDDDEKVRAVVHDALVSGDIDEAVFEEGVTSEIFIDWIALSDFWRFWRSGKLTGIAIQKALAVARELALIDDRWFFLNIEGRGGRLKGTDVVCDTLTKDAIVAWIRKVHESGDGSPAGLVAAIGWETILGKTAQDALLFTLDAFAKKVGLVPEPPKEADQPVGAPTEVPPTGPSSAQPDELAEQAGMPVVIPDAPAIEERADEPASVQDRAVWASAPSEESPKLAEARAKMMEMLGEGERPPAPAQKAWDDSDSPAQANSLEWPEPPPIVAESPKAPTSPPKVPAPNPPPVPRAPPRPR